MRNSLMVWVTTLYDLAFAVHVELLEDGLDLLVRQLAAVGVGQQLIQVFDVPALRPK